MDLSYNLILNMYIGLLLLAEEGVPSSNIIINFLASLKADKCRFYLAFCVYIPVQHKRGAKLFIFGNWQAGVSLAIFKIQPRLLNFAKMNEAIYCMRLNVFQVWSQ